MYWEKEVKKVVEEWIENLQNRDEITPKDFLDYTLFYETQRHKLPSPWMPAMKKRTKGPEDTKTKDKALLVCGSTCLLVYQNQST